jgi:uncharacterized protein (TIGR00730 family)
MRRIAVYCGSSAGASPQFRQAADELGRLLVARECGLVYGGGSVGLMGTLADAVLTAGGDVVGVIPRALATKELLHTGVPDMRIVKTMHDRKALMAELADAFIAMPGGYGTLEELFEVMTWAQLGIHPKSIGLLNVGGYFDHLMRMIDHAIAERFIKPQHRELFVIDQNAETLLDKLQQHQQPVVRKWLDADET